MADCGPAGYGKIGSFEGFCSGGGLAQLGRLCGAACAQRGEPAAWMEGEVTAKSLAEAARAGEIDYIAGYPTVTPDPRAAVDELFALIETL